MTLSLDALSRDNLYERAYVSIRSAIAEGQLLPGVAFTIRDLAEQLEISTTPVREALKRLLAEQALELKPNRSLSVPVIGGKRIIEIRDLRMLLEGLATEKAAAALSEPEIKQLHAMHLDMKVQTNQTAYLKINREFHFTIYERADLPVTLRLIDQLWLQSGPAVSRLMSARNIADIFNGHHAHIVDALARRDGAGAAAAVRADIAAAAEALVAVETENGKQDELQEYA
jgi:DNA-binding GntR family transcriptional regulator